MGEYEEFVKTQRVRALDPLTSVDERIDFLGPRIVDMKNRIQRIEGALATLEVEGVTVMPKKIEQIPFAYTLALAGLPGSGVMLTEYAPFSGYIKQVMIHWPDGCNALVDVRVGHGTKQFCPKNDYLALNNATPIFYFNDPVNDHEEIWVELRNGDGANPHNISCTVFIEGVE